jgi:predicted deacylase
MPLAPMYYLREHFYRWGIIRFSTSGTVMVIPQSVYITYEQTGRFLMIVRMNIMTEQLVFLNFLLSII